ncbi:MAG: LysR family transcriptional regulator [Paracoccus sp. (in: a-proteobacteria)]|uniref:LysR family transcriptional regulator n=1 Tax=Paracoccus sp. TaxID=267 RepID=UPI0026E0C329|nr:LysR family transcriptional regulator [Paracoccus sp. (in: a-proteobacteria)]MDO5613998.1 LysR family transcriptional regulator [Paracoccus sp. (in: a-proteobacteria)]
MDFIDGMRTFVAVADAGSFTAAGQRLGISNKLAGKHVSALETRLGHALLYRSTRALSLTAAGERWLPHAREVLAAVEAAATALDGDGALSGRLRIACGTTMGELIVADVVRDFTARHPAVQVDLVLGDSPADLTAGGFDLAVRLGVPRDSSLRMRRLCATRIRIAASPAYLARAGTPRQPADLAAHQAIIDLNEETPGRWPFRVNGQDITVSPQTNIAVNSASVTIRAAVQGQGLVRAPDIFLAPHLASGALIAVLDQAAVIERQVYLLSHATSFRQPRIAAFADLLRHRFAAMAGNHPAVS